MNFNNWFSNLLRSTSYPTGTSARDIREVAEINTVAISGEAYVSPTCGNIWGGTAYGHIVARMLLNFHLSKYIYTGKDLDNFDFITLEKRLFTYGKACIYKEDDEIVITGFVPETWTYNFKNVKTLRPILVKATQETKDNLGKSIEETVETKGNVLTVGKDCVVIYHDEAEIHHKTIVGPLRKYWSLITDLDYVKAQIDANLSLLNQKIIVDGIADEATLNKISSAFINPNNLALSINKNKTSMASAGFKIRDSMVSFDDRTASLWYSFDRKWGLLKEAFGIEMNMNPGKKERTTNMELGRDCIMACGIKHLEVMKRKIMSKQLKKIGINISVESREDLEDQKESVKGRPVEGQKEVKENE